MNRNRTLLTVAAIGVGIAILLIFSRVDGNASRVGGNASSTASSGTPAEGAGSEGTGATPALVSPSEPGNSQLAANEVQERREITPVHSLTVENTGLAELYGRFLNEDGTPMPGVQLRVSGWGANQERQDRFGVPDEWKDPVAQTETDGTFSLLFEPPRAFQFTLEAKLPGYAKASWRWSEILPGERKDLGDLILMRGGELLVRIEDASGSRLTTGWIVYADTLVRDGGDGRQNTRGRSSRYNSEGFFALPDVPPGRTQIKAYARGANWVTGPTVEVIPGEQHKAVIKYSGPDNSARITVRPSSRPFYVVKASSSSIHLYGPSAQRRTATKIAGSSQSYSFDELPDGEYRIEIRDPRFLPWSRDGVRPGSTVDAHLVGSCVLDVRVLHNVTETEIEDYQARLRFRNVSFSQREFVLRANAERAGSTGAFRGIVPGDFTLLITAPGVGSAELDIDGLSPGERRSLVVRLSPGGTIAGTVQYPRGEVVPHAEVELFPHVPFPEKPEDESKWREWNVTMFEHRSDLRTRKRVSICDAGGRFEFNDLTPGPYDLRTTVLPLIEASADAVLAKADGREEIILLLPRQSSLEGRVLGPAGASFDDLVIELDPTTLSSKDTMFRRPSESTIRSGLDEHGRFRVGPAPPGEYTVRLRLPDTERVGFRSTRRTAGPALDLGTIELAPGNNDGAEFDASLLFPGTLSVRVTRHGATLSGLEVRALMASESGRREGQGTLDQDGHADIAPLFPGEYAVVVNGTDWFAVAPRPYTVESVGVTQCTINVELLSGELLVLDQDTGEPLPNTRIILVPRPPVDDVTLGVQKQVQTDEEGRVQLMLAPGVYLAGDASNPFSALLVGQEGEEVLWTGGEPISAQVSVATADSAGFPNPLEQAGDD